MRWIAVLAVLGAGCHPPTTPVSSPSPAARPAPPPIDQPPPEPDPPPIAAVPAVETLVLERGKPIDAGAGLSIALTSEGHKHAVGGPTIGLWTFEFRDGDRSELVDVRGEDMYLEHVAFGRMVVIDGRSEGKPTVTVHAKAPTPWTKDEAVAEAQRQIAARHVLHDGATTGYSASNGVLRYGVSKADVVYAELEIGLLTKSVVGFDRPAANAKLPRGRKPLKRFELDRGHSKTFAGIRVRFSSLARKIRAPVSRWGFTVRKDGETKRGSYQGRILYLEIAAFDHVFSFRPGRTKAVAVAIHPRRGRALSEGAAARRAAAEVARRGYDADSSAHEVEGGALRYEAHNGNVALCEVVVGLHSRRIVAFRPYTRTPQPAPLPPSQ